MPTISTKSEARAGTNPLSVRFAQIVGFALAALHCDSARIRGFWLVVQRYERAPTGVYAQRFFELENFFGSCFDIGHSLGH